MSKATDGSSSSRRPALDGLRAMAVLLVLAFHVHAPGLQAGYLGVDLFFVLSGYLITSLLVAEHERSGTIRLGEFWARRVRRLLPAFVLVVVAVIAWGTRYMPGYLREKLRNDIIASLAYVANWRFIASTSYFANDETVSPLQHVWSLAIEEQFYFVWPLLAAVAMRVARTKSWPRARVVGVVACGGVTLSLVQLVATYAAPHPERAYMGTDSRAFEPLLGAVLACALTNAPVRAWCMRWRWALVVVGLVGVFAGVATLGAEPQIPAAYFYGGALGFSAACALLIAGVESGPTLVQRVFSLWPIEKLGAISYGAYLWHWAFAVALGVPSDRFDLRRSVLVLVLTLLASTLSYVLVEKPLRYGKASALFAARRLAIVTPALLVSLGASSVLALRGPPKEGFTVLLIGDSVPKRLLPYVAEEAQKRQWYAYSAAVGGCSAIPSVVVGPDGKPWNDSEVCEREVSELQREALVKHRPDVIVWWSRYDATDRIQPSGERLIAGTPRFWAAQVDDLRAMVDRLTASGARLLVVEQDRPGKGMCHAPGCHWFLRHLVERHDLAEHWNAMLRDAAKADPRLQVVSLDPVFCKDMNVPCDDSFEDGLARPDGAHFSAKAGPVVARALLDRIARMR